jgi:hypothetical protein
VDSTGSYANPVWIASLAWSKVTGAPAFLTDPLTTKGDLLARSTSTTRLPVGADGQVLTADSTQTLGVKWGPPGGAASQTPWASDIDAAGFTLKNAGKVGIGTSVPALPLHVTSTAASYPRTAIFENIHSSVQPTDLILRKARGTPGALVAILNGDLIGTIESGGYDGSVYTVAAQIAFIASGAIAANSVPTDIVLYTGTSVGGSERMRITAAGNVGVGITNPTAPLEVTGASVTLRLHGGSATSNNTQLRFFGNAANTDLWVIGTDVHAGSGSKDFEFYDIGTASPVITLQQGTGRVGIGTVTPQVLLQITKSVASGIGPSLWIDNPQSGVGGGGTLDFTCSGFAQPVSVRLQSSDAGAFSSNLLFLTRIPGDHSNGLAERMRITSTGIVSVNRSAPYNDSNWPFQVHVAADQNLLIGSMGGMLTLQTVNDATSLNTVLHYVASAHAFDAGGARRLDILNTGVVYSGSGFWVDGGDLTSTINGSTWYGLGKTTNNLGLQLAGWAGLILKSANTEMYLHPGGGGVSINTGSNPPNAGLSVAIVGSTQIRLVNSTYSTMLYNDNGNFYFLLTNAGDPYGSWNSLRPFYINLPNGLVHMDNGVNIGAGGLTVVGGLTSNSGNLQVNGMARIGGSGYANQVGDLGVSRDSAPATGVVYFGNTGGQYIYWDGGSFAITNSINVTGTGNGYFSGRIGIGTSNPLYRQHIVGAGQTGASSLYWPLNNRDCVLFMQDTGSAGGNGGAILFGAYWDAFAAIKGYVTAGAGTGGSVGDLVFYLRPTTGDTAFYEKMRLASNGILNITGQYQINGTPIMGTGVTWMDSAGTVYGVRPGVRFYAGANVVVEMNDWPAGNYVSVQYAFTSDLRLKQNITDLTGGLTVVNRLRPVRAEWNGLLNKTAGQPMVSVIAQELAEVIPEAVSPLPLPVKLRPEDTEGIELLAIDHMAMISHLLLAVQQLDKRLKALEKVN